MNLTTLNQLIKRSGFKKKYIAKKVGLKQMELSHIIHNRRKAKPEMINKIIKVVSNNKTKPL